MDWPPKVSRPEPKVNRTRRHMSAVASCDSPVLPILAATRRVSRDEDALRAAAGPAQDPAFWNTILTLLDPQK
jgi:hypothetical protein